VCHEQDLVLISIKNEGGRAVTSVVVIVLNFLWKKFCFSHFTCAVRLAFVFVLQI
jgi:hypothetical protein